jgi:hypothetical protein
MVARSVGLSFSFSMAVVIFFSWPSMSLVVDLALRANASAGAFTNRLINCDVDSQNIKRQVTHLYKACLQATTIHAGSQKQEAKLVKVRQLNSHLGCRLLSSKNSKKPELVELGFCLRCLFRFLRCFAACVIQWLLLHVPARAVTSHGSKVMWMT